MKPALPADEAERLVRLHSLQVLDTPGDPVLDGLVRCASAISGCPVALVSLVDGDRQWFKARHGLDAAETPRDEAFCAHAILGDGLFEVPDARRDPRFSDNPLVLGDPNIVFYAGEPLALDGHKLGTLCVIDRAPRQLDATQRELLAGLARAVEHWLASRALKLESDQMHQRCQLAVEAAQLGLIEIDPSRSCVSLDDRAMRQHERHVPGGELSLERWLASFEIGDRERLRAAIGAPARDGATLTLTAALAQSRGGAMRHLEIAMQRLSHAPRWVGSCRDVSESLQLEQLRREKLAAEQSSREKSVFLSRVSHELRTPLNAILGFTQLLQLDVQRPPDPVQHARLEQVHHAGLHLLDLINDVLDLTRFEQGSRPMNLGSVSLDATLDACTSMVEPLAQKMSVELVRADPGDRLRVIADSRALEQVLVNLLSNGVKYNRPGGRLTVGVRTRAAQVEISVTDEGAGLSTRQLGQLFQPFNRLGAENAGVEGSGLGLVIAKNLVEAMGGELVVRSTPGRGSTFAIVLARAGAASAGQTRLGGLTIPGELSDFGSLLPLPRVDAPPATIVYIEDEPVNALLVTEALRHIPQWKVVIATDGEQGLQLARRLRPDLLLVDINIPRLTGDQVVRALRRDADTERLRCIALSADALPEQIAAARAAGFDDYWTKPLDLLTLVPRLLDLLAAEPLPALS